MTEYRVGCGLFDIYAGVLNKDKTAWTDKSKCTDDAICCVRDYMMNDCLGGIDCPKDTSGGYTWKLKDGRTVELKVSILG